MVEGPFAEQLIRLLSGVFPAERARGLLTVLDLDATVFGALGSASQVSRAQVAQALAVALFGDLLDRVPTGRAYVEDVAAEGGKVVFDHGALRTIRFPEAPTGALPPGREAFARILEPLGYREEGVYPLDRLKMTGYAYVQQDFPETLPQYFVSELHVGRFSETFQTAAGRVFNTTREPLGSYGRRLLEDLHRDGAAPEALVVMGLPELAGAFGRWHFAPDVADYEILLAESPEAAWIATEGATFNHATDRVPDVDALAARERSKGRPMKDAVEVSASGRVRQTAFRADPVRREFCSEGGSIIEREVPGSFYEFITRDPLPEPQNGRRLDLRFDSSNAQGIFKMTAGVK
jgi:hypothetical protein